MNLRYGVFGRTYIGLPLELRTIESAKYIDAARN